MNYFSNHTPRTGRGTPFAPGGEDPTGEYQNSPAARARSWLAACALVGALAAGTWSAWAPAWCGGRARAAGSSPGVSLSPPLRITYPSATFAVGIVADCGTNADAVATFVAFDPAYLQVMSLIPDTSRFPTTLVNRYNNGVGSLQYDAGSLTCHAGGNCPSGTVRLATITFRAIGESGSSGPVNLQGEITWQGLTTFNGAGSGSVVAITIAGDMDADCDVDVVDIMLVAARWASEAGQPLYDARYDLDADGDIDIVDIMFVASRWSQSCNISSPLAREAHPRRGGTPFALGGEDPTGEYLPRRGGTEYL